MNHKLINDYSSRNMHASHGKNAHTCKYSLREVLSRFVLMPHQFSHSGDINFPSSHVINALLLDNRLLSGRFSPTNLTYLFFLLVIACSPDCAKLRAMKPTKDCKKHNLARLRPSVRQAGVEVAKVLRGNLICNASRLVDVPAAPRDRHATRCHGRRGEK